jgi:hypothetical protein
MPDILAVRSGKNSPMDDGSVLGMTSISSPLRTVTPPNHSNCDDTDKNALRPDALIANKFAIDLPGLEADRGEFHGSTIQLLRRIQPETLLSHCRCRLLLKLEP